MNRRLSIWSGAAGYNATPEKMVRRIAASGFAYSELSSKHSRDFMTWSSSERSHFRQFAESEGVFFRQGHLLNQVDISSIDEVKRKTFLDDEKRCIDLFLDLGIEIGVIHTGGWEALYQDVPLEKCREILNDSLRILAEYTEKTILRVCIENCPDTVPDVETIRAMVENTDRKNLGYCLDTGHLNLSNPGAGHFIRTCGEKLLALHLNDNIGIRNCSHQEMGYWYADDLHLLPVFCKNAIDWRDAIAALEEIGYSGLWNLEIPGEFHNIPENLVELKLKHCFEWSKAMFCEKCCMEP